MRLIDADAIGLTDFEIIMCDGDFKMGLKMLLDKIQKAPSIQIIQCKNCKHWHREMSKDGTVEYINYSKCLLGNNGDGQDWFCPDGEVKE